MPAYITDWPPPAISAVRSGGARRASSEKNSPTQPLPLTPTATVTANSAATGHAEETPVSRYFADARVLSIFEGAEETLAIRVVGKALVDAQRGG